MLPWSDPAPFARCQPLWNPAQPQSEQRQLIPRVSFFFFLLPPSGKTILAESHSGRRSTLLGLKLVSRDFELEN